MARGSLFTASMALLIVVAPSAAAASVENDSTDPRGDVLVMSFGVKQASVDYPAADVLRASTHEIGPHVVQGVETAASLKAEDWLVNIIGYLGPSAHHFVSFNVQPDGDGCRITAGSMSRDIGDADLVEGTCTMTPTTVEIRWPRTTIPATLSCFDVRYQVQVEVAENPDGYYDPVNWPAAGGLPCGGAAGAGKTGKSPAAPLAAFAGLVVAAVVWRRRAL
ncbi:MAG TPA: hypothetical protein VI818_06275 [Candidatus Thermoplasmatota archaeon]|nr:hypothetical protein [Candidatus Thermoplasmatota archaeon]